VVLSPTGRLQKKKRTSGMMFLGVCLGGDFYGGEKGQTFAIPSFLIEERRKSNKMQRITFKSKHL
jgi:hypothetical protein